MWRKRMNPDIKKHIKTWLIANVVVYAICVGLFAIRSEMATDIFNRPFLFIIEKITASVVGISFLTGVTIYAEVFSNVPILKKVSENPLALAIYSGAVLYCVSWIWTYS